MKKHQVSNPFWIKNDSHCTPTHMTDSMTHPHTTSHISLKIPSVFRHPHNNMVRQQEDRGGAWCAGVDNAALAAEAAFGCRRGVAQCSATTWCGGWCVRHVFVACFVSHFFGVSSVSLVCGPMAVMKSAFVPQRSSTPGFLLTHAAQSPVFANVCRRLQRP